MTYSILWLAQIQFFSAFGFLVLFMALELGLAWVLLFFRVRTLSVNAAGWTEAYRFWVRVFALASALGFAAGVSLLIQLGGLWPGLIDRIGDVAGPMLAAVVALTFFFKTCFLGLMLFSARRMAGMLHAIVVGLVAIGSSLATFFVVALVAWTHTPSGAILFNGQYVVTDPWRVLFSPALPWYVGLFVGMAALMVAFLMLAVTAGQANRNPKGPSYRLVFRTALIVALAGIVMQGVAVTGTVHLAAQHQPAKAAALAGYWETGSRPDLAVVGWPDSATHSNRWAWVWPGRASAWLGPGTDGNWYGLDHFSGMSPPVALTFWSFRLMLMVTLLMAVVALWCWLGVRRHDFDPAVLSRTARCGIRFMGASGWVLMLLGLVYIQAGVFPYAVYGTITLTEIMTSAGATVLVFSNALYSVCYVGLFVGFFKLLRYFARYGVIPVRRRRGVA